MRSREVLPYPVPESKRQRNDVANTYLVDYRLCIRHGNHYREYNCPYCIEQKSIICDRVNNEFFDVLPEPTKSTRLFVVGRSGN